MFKFYITFNDLFLFACYGEHVRISQYGCEFLHLNLQSLH